MPAVSKPTASSVAVATGATHRTRGEVPATAAREGGPFDDDAVRHGTDATGGPNGPLVLFVGLPVLPLRVPVHDRGVPKLWSD